MSHNGYHDQASSFFHMARADPPTISALDLDNVRHHPRRSPHPKRSLPVLDCSRSSVLKAMISSGGGALLRLPSRDLWRMDGCTVMAIQCIVLLVLCILVSFSCLYTPTVPIFTRANRFCTMVLAPPPPSDPDPGVLGTRGFSESPSSGNPDAGPCDYARNVLHCLTVPCCQRRIHDKKRGGRIDFHRCGQQCAIELVRSSSSRAAYIVVRSNRASSAKDAPVSPSMATSANGACA